MSALVLPLLLPPNAKTSFAELMLAVPYPVSDLIGNIFRNQTRWFWKRGLDYCRKEPLEKREEEVR